MNLILRSRSPFALRSPVYDRSVARLVDNLFDDFLAPRALSAQEPVVATPRIDLVETAEAYEVQAELPGVAKEDIKVTVDHNLVSIEAEVKRAAERKEGENVLHSERSVAKFARSFTLAADLDDSRTVARFENGVLTLTLAKKEQKQPKQIAIQ
jgi:HSP20 family protein